MTDRFEYAWNLDGFVDEQRYYFSEKPIDPLNLPIPKAVLTSDARAYIDTDVTYGKTYRVRFSSVRDNVEKVSSEIIADTLSDKVVALLYFDGNIDDAAGKGTYTKTGGVSFANDGIFGEPAIKISNTQDYVASSSGISSNLWQFGSSDFCIEFPMLSLDITNFQSVITKWINGNNPSCEILLYLQSSTLGFAVRKNDAQTYVTLFTVSATQLLQKTQVTLARRGDKFWLWFGNTLITEVVSSVIINSAPAVPVLIGGSTAIGIPFNGYIGKMRVTKGDSRYSLANPPSQIANY